jgi:cytochrome c553
VKFEGVAMNIWFKTSAGIALLSLCAWSLAADPLQVRSMAAACASCHGTAGIALSGMESLAGQPKDDLLKKMLDFKSGKKPATIMHQLAKGYSDEQLEQLAGYFAALKK